MRSRFHYPMLQSLLWGIYGVLQTYVNRYLLERGMSNTQIGVLLGASTALAFVLQPVLGALADARKLTMRQVLLLCTGFMLLGTMGLLLPGSMGLIVICYAADYTMLNVIPSFVNALGVQGVKAGLSIDLGRARGMGSVTFSITTQIGSWLIAAHGLQTVPLFSLVLVVGMMLVIATFPKVVADCEKKQKVQDGAAAFFRRNPFIILLLFANFFVSISHSGIRNAMYQIALWKGGVNAHGTAMSLGAFLEFPVTFAFSWMLTQKKCSFWIRFCAIFYVVRSFLLLTLPGVTGLYVAQAAQALGSGMNLVASVYYVANSLEGEDAVRGQWYMGASSTFASLIAYVSSGALLDRVTVPTLLGATTAMALMGAMLMFAAVNRVDHPTTK